jgi:hypothetical protein
LIGESETGDWISAALGVGGGVAEVAKAFALF